MNLNIYTKKKKKITQTPNPNENLDEVVTIDER